ncbi:hypothetical protein [Alkalibacillus aidingensis]|uniref:hypothetical protein n=1 Tax=Alkalibacillus aidingensis TaxID=2747607 RepID=UPI0016603CB4|nr:hypothetical protein [Alkalibacillus aidingensis]
MNRKLILNENYIPLPCHQDDEVFANGIFNFNISRMIEQIHSGTLSVKSERIDVKDWFNAHPHPSINEEHLPNVDLTNPVIQVEIRPGHYSIIDGNHRMEKAYREGVQFVDSYKLNGEQLVPFFIDHMGYRAFVDYWNSKLV